MKYQMCFRVGLLTGYLALVVAMGCGDDGAARRPDAGQPATIDGAVPIDAGPALDCATYCTQVQKNCTGDNAQYADAAHCMAACSAFAVTNSTLNDETGNTLGCRIHFALDAARTDAAADDCAFAGPVGDRVSSAKSGHCSGDDICASFCAIEIKACGSQAQPLKDNPRDADGSPLYQYRDEDGCLSSCQVWNRNFGYHLNSVGDDFSCRILQAVDASVAVTPNGKTSCASTAASGRAPCAGVPAP